ncbi:MAG: hypothetical protein AAF360_12805 [Pseudomonadota bacterium]
MEGPAVSMLDLMLGGVQIMPIMVGSRVTLERVVAANNIEIPVHKTFAFADAPAAFAEQMSGAAFGKAALSIDEGTTA